MPAPDLILTFRDAIRERSPRWLRFGLALRILYAFGASFDALADACVQAIRRRWPGVNDDNLGLLGRDRKIRRGPLETAATYVVRLLRWLTDHQTRGGPYALLDQVGAYYAPTPFGIGLRYESGTYFTRDATTGAITRAIGAPFDPNISRWARWWLMYEWPTSVNVDGTWGSGGTWSDGGVWDSDLSAATVADLRLVPNEWNAAHPIGHVILLSDGAELWDWPAGLWSDPGVWGGSGGQAIVNLP